LDADSKDHRSLTPAPSRQFDRVSRGRQAIWLPAESL
jgi:hypothetical protein